MPDQTTTQAVPGVTRWRAKKVVEAIQVPGFISSAVEAFTAGTHLEWEHDDASLLLGVVMRLDPSLPVVGRLAIGDWIVRVPGTSRFAGYRAAEFAEKFEPAEPPVPSAEQAQLAVAVAALRRLALDEPMAAVADADAAGLGEFSARIDYAASALETIARIGADGPEPAAGVNSGTGAGEAPSQAAMRLLDAASGIISSAKGIAGSAILGGPWKVAAAEWYEQHDALVTAHAGGRPGPEDEPPLPPGEFARVEIMGRDKVTGFVTERTRAGQPVMVISGWDGRVLAEIPGQSLYRFTPLATPLKRPDAGAQLALPRSTSMRPCGCDGWTVCDECGEPGAPF